MKSCSEQLLLRIFIGQGVSFFPYCLSNQVTKVREQVARVIMSISKSEKSLTNTHKVDSSLCGQM